MGTFKEYSGGLALKSLNSYIQNNNDTVSDTSKVNAIVANYRDVNGTVHDNIYTRLNTTSQDRIWKNLFPYSFYKNIYASEDAIENYSSGMYSVSNDVQCSFTVSRLVSTQRVYTVAFSNNTQEEKTYKSIKFVKDLNTWYKGAETSVYVLCYGYYLDEPITLQPGETKTIVITFDFS